MNLTDTNKRKVETLVEQWRAGFEKGIETITEACRALAEAYDLAPKYAESLVEDMNIPPEALKRMLEVGRGKRAERLLTEATAGESALAKCDISLQRRYLEESVPVLNPSDPTQHRLIPVPELTLAQARQVFVNGTVRTLGQQRSYIETHQPAPAVKMDKCYIVMRGKIRWLKPCEVSVGELAGILEEAVR